MTTANISKQLTGGACPIDRVSEIRGTFRGNIYGGDEHAEAYCVVRSQDFAGEPNNGAQIGDVVIDPAMDSGSRTVVYVVESVSDVYHTDRMMDFAAYGKAQWYRTCALRKIHTTNALPSYA